MGGPIASHMNADLDSALKGIAEAGQTPIEEVWETIAALKRAGQEVIIIRSRSVPSLLSVDPERRKVYLINDFPSPGHEVLRWALRLRELADCTSQPIFHDDHREDVVLALLIMGAGLNSVGLMLDLAIYQKQPFDGTLIRILDQHGAVHGTINSLHGQNGIMFDAPATVQVAAFEAYLAALYEVKRWNINCRNLKLFTMQYEELPPHLARFVRSSKDYVANIIREYELKYKQKQIKQEALAVETP
jgi:hypothetical protein